MSKLNLDERERLGILIIWHLAMAEVDTVDSPKYHRAMVEFYKRKLNG